MKMDLAAFSETVLNKMLNMGQRVSIASCKDNCSCLKQSYAHLAQRAM